MIVMKRILRDILDIFLGLYMFYCRFGRKLYDGLISRVVIFTCVSVATIYSNKIFQNLIIRTL